MRGRTVQWRCLGPIKPSEPVKHRNPKIANAAINKDVIMRASLRPALTTRIAGQLILRDMPRATYRS